MKKIQEHVISDMIQLIQNSTFYNKVQITFDHKDLSQKTETFYFSDDKISHSIFEEKDGEANTIQELKIYEGTNELKVRLHALPEDAKIIIAGNSPDNILSLG